MQESFWLSKFSTRSGARKRDLWWRKFRKETVEKGIVETEVQKENCGKTTVETVVETGNIYEPVRRETLQVDKQK